MTQAQHLVTELKNALKEAGKTYRDLAEHLDLSEASVKRLFSQQGFSLARMEQVLGWLGLDFADLVERARSRRELLKELTPEQEDALVSDPDFFVITFLVLNRWPIEEIVEEYRFTEKDVEKALLRLNRLEIIELLPFNRYRLRTSRNFAWRRDGSVSAFFKAHVMPEFFASYFDGPGEELAILGGMLSAPSIASMQEGVTRLAAQFADLANQDARLPLEEKTGCSAVLAFRPIEYSMFVERRRGDRPPRRLRLE